jgi:trehalose 6-phosphate synthase/phosphatase
LFCILPWRNRLLLGLLGADVLGFHTERYAVNFLECVEQLTEARVDLKRRTVRSSHGETRVIVAPIGIPTEQIEKLVADPWVRQKAKELRRAMGDRRMVLGVDRLDYTKGIPERLLAYEALLSRARSNREQWVMVQIMVPSRTDVQAYATLKAEVDRLVGSIDGRYGRTGLVPIHYLYRSLDPRELYAHYLAADIALVTPLRDGMNLVAQEYVATRHDESGVLVLSELAGASDYLEGSICVNPYDIDEIADALERARDMDPVEIHRRMRSMRAAVAKLDVHRWARGFLDQLEGVSAEPARAVAPRA